MKKESSVEKNSFDLIYEAAFVDELEKIAACKSHSGVKPKKAVKVGTIEKTGGFTPAEKIKLKKMPQLDIDKLEGLTPGQIERLQTGTGVVSALGLGGAAGGLMLSGDKLEMLGERLDQPSRLNKGYKKYIKTLEKTPYGSPVNMKLKKPILSRIKRPVGKLLKRMSKSKLDLKILLPVMLAGSIIPSTAYHSIASRAVERGNLKKRLRKS